jgi:hypothetical protein
MTSIPQLRKDINDLQAKLRAAQNKIKELESRKPDIKTVYVDRPVQVIKRVEVPVEKIVYKEKLVEVPKQVIKVVEKETAGPVQYRDNPAHIEMIRRLQRANSV